MKKIIFILLIILLFPLIGMAQDNYISPTGHSDVSSVWTNETDAYDSDTGTYANASIAKQTWCGYLEFTFDEISCDKIKIWVDRQYAVVNDMEIDYYNGSWVSLRSGNFTTGSYQEYAIGSTVDITKIRVRAYNDTTGYHINWFRIHEVMLNSVAGFPVTFNGATITKWNEAEISKWNGVE